MRLSPDPRLEGLSDAAAESEEVAAAEVALHVTAGVAVSEGAAAYIVGPEVAVVSAAAGVDRQVELPCRMS